MNAIDFSWVVIVPVSFILCFIFGIVFDVLKNLKKIKINDKDAGSARCIDLVNNDDLFFATLKEYAYKF
ncbi:hypothetical protein ACFFU9_13365 [Mariniflexile ostreae]|uniref:Uncharacterized protein n=1 Tax=Mariniflexile ostreae TaxID=1520892 RepID=A0ABV5FE77_9FLAO